jgi:hypothetical protein
LLEQVFVVGMAVLLAAVAGAYLSRGRLQRAEDQVLLWESRVGLPRDDVARADAIRRVLRRTSIGSWYTLLGLFAGTVVLIGDVTTIGLAGYQACGLIGYSVGVWRVHLADLRERSAGAGTRAAVLRRRRLLDFLTPAEVVAPWIMLLIPALSLFVGIDMLATDRVQATILIAVALLHLVVFAVAQVLQRRVLRIGHVADTEAAMRWEEAHRALVLRELAQPAIWGPFALGVFLYVASTLDRLDGLAGLGSALAILPPMWVVWSTAGRQAWRRSQRQFEPEPVE